MDNQINNITSVSLVYELLAVAGFNPQANMNTNGDMVSLNVTLDERFIGVLKDIAIGFRELSTARKGVNCI